MPARQIEMSVTQNTELDAGVAAGRMSSDSSLTPTRFALLPGLLVFATFPGVLLGRATFNVRDFGMFSYPVASFHRQCFWNREWPLWNPYHTCRLLFLQLPAHSERGANYSASTHDWWRVPGHRGSPGAAPRGAALRGHSIDGGRGAVRSRIIGVFHSLAGKARSAGIGWRPTKQRPPKSCGQRDSLVSRRSITSSQDAG